MTWIEVLGFVTGAVSVAFAVRESAWNWPVGIANNVFFFVLFWKAKLYADALLQIVYVIISIYGWWNWLHERLVRHGDCEAGGISSKIGSRWRLHQNAFQPGDVDEMGESF